MGRSPSSRRYALRHQRVGKAEGAPSWTPTVVTGHGEAATEGGPLIHNHSLTYHLNKGAHPFLVPNHERHQGLEGKHGAHLEK